VWANRIVCSIILFPSTTTATTTTATTAYNMLVLDRGRSTGWRRLRTQSRVAASAQPFQTGLPAQT